MLVLEKEIIILKNNIPVVSHIVIAENTGNEKISIRKLIDNYKEKLEMFWVLSFEMTEPNKNWWRPEKEYFLNEEQATFLMTLLKNNEVVVDFKLRLVKAFYNLKNNFYHLPKSFSEALRMLASAEEEKEKLFLENKELEKTKAWINNKKTATAMNTASRYAKINKKLEKELDKSKEYATVKRMELLYHWQKFNWRLLKTTWIEMWIDTIDVFDVNYWTVKAYHNIVWKEAYWIEII